MKEDRLKRSYIVQIQFCEISEISKSTEMEHRLVTARAQGKGGQGSSCLMGKERETPWDWTEMVVAQHCDYTNNITELFQHG